MKRIRLIAVAIVTGCSAVSGDHIRNQSKTRISITDYADSQMKHSETTFEEFRTKMAVREYYVYRGDRMLGASAFLERPIFTSGHSIGNIAQHGNRIYAIPIYRYRVGVNAKVMYFWLIAERGGKIYMIANAGMEVKEFNRDFKQPLLKQ